MRLKPVYEGDEPAGVQSATLPNGTVHVSHDRQQMIGVRLGTVERKTLSRALRTVGRVESDETRIYRVTAATTGWIEEAMPNSVGSLVRKDQVLATYYAREFLGAQQAYFYALDARDRFLKQKAGEAQMASTNVQIQSSMDNLLALGMTRPQIAHLEKTRDRAYRVEIRAPAAGFILERNVSPGQRFESGQEFYRIADLTRVWVLADVFEHEGPEIMPGRRAHIRYLRELRGAIVSDVLPIFDAQARTLKVRLELDNPGFRLRPGMFVDVEIPLEPRNGITVPADAVTHTGLHKIVFVDLGNGGFEPRQVETGWRSGDSVEITSGLMEGERIAVSGTFLLDSETRMRAGITKSSATSDAVDPVCGMNVDPDDALQADRVAEIGGRKFYFCAHACLHAFTQNPTKYVK